MEMQVKLLRVCRSASSGPSFHAVAQVDLRIVAATHRDLKRRWPPDASVRICTTGSTCSPSTCRAAQPQGRHPLLVDHFLGGYGFHPSREILDVLHSYDWPGNVRELQHCVERMAAMQSEGALQMATCFGPAVPSGVQRSGEPLRRGGVGPRSARWRSLRGRRDFAARQRKADHRNALRRRGRTRQSCPLLESAVPLCIER